ncbi:MAG: TPM domain-containing protein [Bacteroidetes bacterium]|nr:TPM domain-containing protein [Bacteroidota bacterium]MBU1116866.1 TPM domain-containing protein [Bacteroidota bacterium]MBU1797456.1 TPM domain-containing protein [Bacteroidota bacterium]
MKNELLYHFFSDDDFLDISNKINEAEKFTSGEIRVAIKDSVPILKTNKGIKDLATDEFIKLGMAETRDKTGILIYIVLSKRKFYILADSGINEKVEQSTWDNIRNDMESEFKNGNYLSGVIDAIDKVGNILNTYFPIKKDDTNELSNRVMV